MTRLPLVPTMFESPARLLDGNDPWQMGFGERALVVGLLSDMRPKLAIEIGTAEGGSLRRIASMSEEVHSFDLVEPDPSIAELSNVTLHTGDSHALLPQLLEKLAAEGRNVDFVLVDGDHSRDGVAQDMRDLIESPALRRSVILMHDSMNEEVRAGLDAVDYEGYEKVRYVEMDCVAGFLFREPLDQELWGGLGLVVVEADRPRKAGEFAQQQRYHPHHRLMVAARDASATAGSQQAEASAEVAELRRQLEAHKAGLATVRSSLSWRVTAPLRGLKSRIKR